MNPFVSALRRPLTVMVLVVGVALGSTLAVTRMSIDMFPNLNLRNHPTGSVKRFSASGVAFASESHHRQAANGMYRECV
jgi:hypothetical protein